jgi:hypothetical protein
MKQQDFFDQLTKQLEPDERVIFKSMYLDKPWMYGRVRGLMYILQYNDPETGESILDCVDDKWLGYAMNRYPECVVVSEMLLVETRDKFPDGLEGELLSSDAYQEYRDECTVLDVYVLVVSRHPPYYTKSLSVDAYQRSRLEYEVLDVGYIVAPHSPKKVEEIYYGYEKK